MSDTSQRIIRVMSNHSMILLIMRYLEFQDTRLREMRKSGEIGKKEVNMSIQTAHHWVQEFVEEQGPNIGMTTDDLLERMSEVVEEDFQLICDTCKSRIIESHRGVK